MATYKNFDNFFKEANPTKKNLKITLFDKEYEFKGTLPATMVLAQYRALKGGNSEITEAEQVGMAVKMVGEETLEEWCDLGLQTDQLTEIISWMMKEITGHKPSESGEKDSESGKK